MADLRLFASQSNMVRFILKDKSTGQGKTGLSTASSGLIISTIADNESSATTYSGSNLETISTLGTFATPTSGKCRFKEVDAINHKGMYEFQFANARFAVTSSRRLIISVTDGDTAILDTDYEIELVQFDPFSATNLGLSSLPSVAPGVANGLLINGSNAGTITFSAGVVISQSNSNTAGLSITGNGSASGMAITGGATGAGAKFTGGGTSGAGIQIITTSGDGILISPTVGHGISSTGDSSGKHGIHAVGNGTNGVGVNALGGGSGSGFVGTGGSSSGSGANMVGGTGGIGLRAAGNGASPGAKFIGGATGAALNLVGGSTSGEGISIATTSGDGILVAPTVGHGISTTGNGTTKHGIHTVGGATTSHGINALGGGVGHGINSTSGSGATGDGIHAVAASTNGNGFGSSGTGSGHGFFLAAGSTGNGIKIVTTAGDGVLISPTGGHGLNLLADGTSKHGILSTGGTGGTSDGFKCVAGTGGVAIRALTITGDLTGRVLGDSSTTIVGIVGNVNISQIDGSPTAATNQKKAALVALPGSITTATSLTTTTLIDSTLTQADDNFFNGRIIMFLSGNLQYQGAKITAFNHTTHMLTFDALTQAPANGDTYIIL